MESALVISKNEKSAQQLVKMLETMSVSGTAVSLSGSEARQRLIDREYDLYVINTPLEDEFGEKLARDISERHSGGVLLLVRAEIYEEVSEKVAEYGVIALAKPLSKSLFWASLKLFEAVNRKLRLMESENRRLLRKIDDIRLVDRAKCLLVSTLAMTEPEAHRYIEKQSMDLRLTKTEVAREILKTYEN